MSSALNAGARFGLQQAIAAVAMTGTPGASAAIDLAQFEGWGLFVLDAGVATAGTTKTLNVKIQHSDASGSGFVDSGVAFTQVTTTASLQKIVQKFRDLKRYIKFVPALGSTDCVYPVSAHVVGYERNLAGFTGV